ncbi:hypothetical protein ACQP1U_10780 [Actinomycetota bacterium]
MGIFDRFRGASRDRRGVGDRRDAGSGNGPLRIGESRGTAWLTLELGDLPSDSAVIEAGEEPNGAFWEGVAGYLAPDIVSRLELDSEGSMFSVAGGRADIDALVTLLEPLVQDGPTMAALVQRAHAAGMTLEGHALDDHG